MGLAGSRASRRIGRPMKILATFRTGSILASLLLPAAAQTTVRVSVDSGGAQTNSISGNPSVSANGRYVAFESIGTTLVAGDTNSACDVFVHDLWTATTERVSLDSAEAEADSDSFRATLSADGRFVAFYSFATNLVAGDTNGVYDVYVRDRVLGTTVRASVDSAEAQVLGDCILPAISGDGRYVAFYSLAGALAPPDVNGAYDVYVRDLFLGTTERVSLDSAELPTNGPSTNPAISDDGRYVAFTSGATNLVAGDTNAVNDIFVRDRVAGTTARVSISMGGAQANGGSDEPSISADGRFVAFWSDGSNLVPGDTNGQEDMFVHDRNTGATVRASVSTGGGQANIGAARGRISADGRFVGFESNSSNLVPGDTNATTDVFVHDLVGVSTQLASLTTGGVQGNAFSFGAAVSGDGRIVAFASEATNLVAGDTNAVRDAFVRDRAPNAFTSFCDPGSGGVVACPCGNPPSGPNRGCQNHGTATGGATIVGSGLASLAADSVLLSATNENASSLTVFWTGQTLLAPPGVAHAAGVRCAATLHRLYSGNASGGAIARPGGSDPSVSARSAAVGAPITAGQTRYYFTIYRDPQAAAPCGNSASTINLTNALRVTWAP